MDIKVRLANTVDLKAINQLIEAAVMAWNLPERVKRLSLSSVTYNDHDFHYYQMAIAVIGNTLAGVVILDHETYREEKTSLIHGIYVHPKKQRNGIGTRLLQEAETLALNEKSTSILVKSQKDAQGFFTAAGMNKLAIENEQQDYATRYEKKIG